MSLYGIFPIVEQFDQNVSGDVCAKSGYRHG